MNRVLTCLMAFFVLAIAHPAEASEPDWKQVLRGIEAGGTTLKVASEGEPGCRVWATLDPKTFSAALPLMSALNGSGGITPDILSTHRIQALVGYAAFIAPTVWVPALYATHPKLNDCQFTTYIRGGDGIDNPIAVWDFTRALYRRTDWAHQRPDEPITTLRNFELLGHAYMLLEGKIDLDK
ncbi:MAG: hypothetical protein JOZ17_03490 [Acetobacteraceae bacterium]|nr:hypothetical protein [Acetobacteraceae bacterium]